MSTTTLKILQVNASARRNGSTTRRLSEELVSKLAAKGEAKVKVRELADGVPFVDEEWVAANFTPVENRTARHTATLAYSESLIEELEEADVIVIGVPVYNFGVPAALKAWIDMVTRARRTFEYTDKGPVGLLKDKRAVLVVGSGGVTVGSEADFATRYLKFVLGFIGVTDIEIVAAEGQAYDADGAAARARASLDATLKSLSESLLQAA
ncbi:MAG: NAD(P)H-dependent oxidoreductase [Pseudomonadota bacterium]|nr:NAD(P)H-dependent oxidoreductase [Pseudomonadota bacterium]